MRNVSMFLITLLATCAGLAEATAQEPGTRLRVLVPHPFEGAVQRLGVLERIDGDSLWVRVGDRSTRLSLEEAHAALPTGENYSRQGRVAGALIGIVAGGVVGYLHYESEPQTCTQGGVSSWFGPYSGHCYGGVDETMWAFDTILGAGIGLGVGLVTGWLIGSQMERWVPLDVQAVPAVDGSISVTLRR